MWPVDNNTLSEVALALRDSAEFALITRVVDPHAFGAIKSELRRTVGGTVTQDEARREPYQLQAQFFFGAILTYSGVNLGMPPSGGPDFLVENGLRHHGIEVKAPETANGFERSLKKAADQLSTVQGRGAVVIDVSEIVAASVPSTPPVHETEDQLKVLVDAELHVQTEKLRSIITGGHGHAALSRYSSIISLFTICRTHRWQVTGPGTYEPASALACTWRRIYRHRGILDYHRGGWLGDLLDQALRALAPSVEIKDVP
jgi:hypothetical protein